MLAATQTESIAPRAKIAVPLLITGFCAVAVALSFVLNVWVDEAFSLNTTSGDLRQAFHRAVVFEWQAPLYFLVLDAWRAAGHSVAVARLLSVACAVATLALVPGLARRYVADAPPEAILLAAATAPFLIWAAVEVRPYAMVILLSAIFLRALHDEISNVRWKAPISLCLSGAALVYTHYFAGALIAGGIAWAAIAGRRRGLARYAAACAVMGILILPLAFLLPAQIGSFESTSPGSNSIETARRLIGALANFINPMYFAMRPRAEFLATGIFLTILFIDLLRRGRRPSPECAALAALAFVSCFVLWAVAAITGSSLVLPRYAASVFLPALILPFALLAALMPSRPRQAAWFWAALVGVLGVWASFQTYRPLAKQGDWTRVARYLDANNTWGGAIAVFKADDALALEEAMESRTGIVPLPHPLSLDQPWTAEELTVRRPRDVSALLSKDAGRRGRVWLVTTDVCSWEGVSYGCDVLESAVSADWNVVSEQHFYESTVRLLTRRPARRAAERPSLSKVSAG